MKQRAITLIVALAGLLLSSCSAIELQQQNATADALAEAPVSTEPHSRH